MDTGDSTYSQDWQGNITFPQLGLRFRVLTPRDFYKIEYEDLDTVSICRFLCANKKVYDLIPYSFFVGKLYPILLKELLQDRVYSVQSWLTVAFYLQGRKWGVDLDWLEKQPIDKINMLIDILAESKQPQDGIDMLC